MSVMLNGLVNMLLIVEYESCSLENEEVMNYLDIMRVYFFVFNLV